MRILFVTSEAAPLMKTGGLADVSANLPRALRELGHDARILTPGYADTLAGLPEPPGRVAGFRPPPGARDTALRASVLARGDVPVYLLDAPGFSDRPGNPYHHPDGGDYADNAERFDRLARAGAWLAAGRAGLDWSPDIVHCNDWQTGLTPLYMMLWRVPAASVFTIHNLAYQGLFPPETLSALGLPAWLWHYEALEFRDRLSFMKGGLIFADRLSTVSPRYAQEIRTPEFGEGLEGLLESRADDLTGIMNGIDEREWNPADDPWLPAHYDADDPAGKTRNKRELRRETGLQPASRTPVIGMIGRLAHQKGVDLVLDALDGLMKLRLQMVVLGSGYPPFERALRLAAERHPDRVAVRIGYDEGLAHRIEAGADMFLMPSRFEPCGLNQLYSLRYGTVPVVRRTGGLADSVVDASETAIEAGRATGISFDAATPAALLDAVERALALYRRRNVWRAMVERGMRRDFSWPRSAARYAELYEETLSARG